MVKRLDISGKRFGMLTALSYFGRSETKKPRPMWLCKCDCGKQHITQTVYLTRGGTLSCGCISRIVRKKHGMKGTRTYESWSAMKARCNRESSVNYPNYGARGITACKRWDKFENFLADMGECPVGMTLDRYPDNNGNYEPGNCRWATAQQQARNRRDNKIIQFRGKTQCLQAWANELGIYKNALLYRLKAWTLERALTQPPARRR